MKNIAFAIGAAMTLTATPAFAASLFLGAGGPNYDEMIHENHAGSGQVLALKSKPGGYLVDFSVPAG